MTEAWLQKTFFFMNQFSHKSVMRCDWWVGARERKKVLVRELICDGFWQAVDKALLTIQNQKPFLPPIPRTVWKKRKEKEKRGETGGFLESGSRMVFGFGILSQ